MNKTKLEYGNILSSKLFEIKSFNLLKMRNRFFKLNNYSTAMTPNFYSYNTSAFTL